MITMDIDHFQRQPLNDPTDTTAIVPLNEANSRFLSQDRNKHNDNNKKRCWEEDVLHSITSMRPVTATIMGVQRKSDEGANVVFCDRLPLGRSTMEQSSLRAVASATTNQNCNFSDSSPYYCFSAQNSPVALGTTLLPGRRSKSNDDNMAEVVISGDKTACCPLEKHIFCGFTSEIENDSLSDKMPMEPRPIKDINGRKSFASTGSLSDKALLPILMISSSPTKGFFETRFTIGGSMNGKRSSTTTSEVESGILAQKYSCPFPSSLDPSRRTSAIAIHEGDMHHDNKKLSKKIVASIRNKETNKKQAELAKATQAQPKEDHHSGSLLKAYKPDHHSPSPSPTGSLPTNQQDRTISMTRDEDCNWLSEFQCLVRSDVLELFVTTNHTNNTNIYQPKESSQEVVGIRCRFCTRQEVRARRSTAFPSDISKIYQSVSMMIRDHIPKCSEIPLSLQLRLKHLQNSSKQSAWGVKHYWEYSASAIGLFDTPNGLRWARHNCCKSNKNDTGDRNSVHLNQDISMSVNNNNTSNQEMKPYAPPFGQAGNAVASTTSIPLITEHDNLISPPAFYFEVMKQVELVHLDPSEIRAYRGVLKQGHSGFGCIYCGEAGRMGFSRKFPMTRKRLPGKIEEMSNHLIRCNLCPRPVQEHLRDLCCKERLTAKMKVRRTAFMDLIWKRLWIEDKRV